MLDQESDLSELLSCPNCKRIYDEPNILPCGKIVCKECVKIILYKINKTSKQFKCLLCTDYHQLPKASQFPICEPLVKMIKKHATELYSNNCQLNQNLTQNMKRIKSQVNQLKKDMLNGNFLSSIQ